MRSLFISTANAVEVNAALVRRAATSLVAAGPSAQPSAAPNADTCLDIFVHVHDSCRATFLLHAQHLYGIALECTPTLQVDVVPVHSQVVLAHPLATLDAMRCEELSDENMAALYAAALAPVSSSLSCGNSSSSSSQNGPPALFTAATMIAEKNAGFAPLYRYVAVGGTFDHLHAGHKLLLTTAALHASEKLRCGVTGEALLTKKKFAERLQPIESRKDGAMKFLRKLRPDLEVEIDTIMDVGGGADTIADIEALAVSPETEKALEIINGLRAKNGGLRPLECIRIPYVTTATGEVLSSTAIRQKYEQSHPSR